MVAAVLMRHEGDDVDADLLSPTGLRVVPSPKHNLDPVRQITLMDVHTAKQDWTQIHNDVFRNVDFADLVETSNVTCTIKEPKFRAITLEQLDSIINHVKHRLLSEKWVVGRSVQGETQFNRETPITNVEQVNL